MQQWGDDAYRAALLATANPANEYTGTGRTAPRTGDAAGTGRRAGCANRAAAHTDRHANTDHQPDRACRARADGNDATVHADPDAVDERWLLPEPGLAPG